MPTQTDKAVAFRALHSRGRAFVIPNPWDAGSAKILAGFGFEALATTSAGLAFLEAVNPQYALISVGANNPFGLPKLDVLERLGSRRILTYRTDLDGAVTFILDGRLVTPVLADFQ